MRTRFSQPNLRRRFNPMILVGAFMALVLVLGIGLTVASYNNEEQHLGCKVSDKDRTVTTDNNGNRQTEARVYTDNCGVFIVDDALFKGHFNSADTFGSIKEGKSYDFTTIGFRFGFLSMFPNIIDVTPSS